jgi:hypothetical protein
MSYWWRNGGSDLAARARTGRRGDTPLPPEAIRGIAVPRPREGLIGDPPLPPPVDFPSLERDALGAAGRQRKKAAKNALLLEGQPADAAATAPKATLNRRRLGGGIVAY